MKHRRGGRLNVALTQCVAPSNDRNWRTPSVPGRPRTAERDRFRPFEKPSAKDHSLRSADGQCRDVRFLAPRGLKKVPVRHEFGGAMAAMSDRLSGAMAFKALQPLDGHGFADLVMTPRRPAAQPAPLHCVDHRTLARSPIRDQLHRRLQPSCYLHDYSGCFRLERLPSGPCTHWKAPPYSRRTRSADVADSAVAAGGKRSTALNAIERLPHAAQS